MSNANQHLPRIVTMLKRGANIGEIARDLGVSPFIVKRSVVGLRSSLGLAQTDTRALLILRLHGRTQEDPGQPSPRFLTILGRLTPRQKEVALLAVRGRSNAEIARLMGIGIGSVSSHMENVLVCAEAADREALVCLYCGSDPYFTPIREMTLAGSGYTDAQPHWHAQVIGNRRF